MQASLPAEFRAKYDQLLTVIDSRTGKPVAESLGRPSQDPKTHPSGGVRYTFTDGSLYTFDHTGRYPVLAVWGAIHIFYSNLANFEGGFGRPLTDVTDLQDGGRCCIFEGGHLHQYGEKVEPFPAANCVAPYQPQVPPFPFGIGPAGMPIAFHQKWVSLSLQKDSRGKTIAEHLSLPCLKLRENENGGQSFNFLGGDLMTLDNRSPPFVCYGAIRNTWSNVGGVTGGLGHPLSDPQDIEGGRCQIFQGGHIHEIGNQVYTSSGTGCAAVPQIGSPPSWNTMPPHFQRKWTALCSVVHPHTRVTIAEMLGRPCLLLNDNPKNLGGQHFNFLGGEMVSLSMNPQATPFSQPPMMPHGHSAGYPPQGLPGAYGMTPPAGYPPSPPSHPFDGAISNYPHGAAPPTSSFPGPSPFPGGPQFVPGLAPVGQERPLVLIEPFYVTGVIKDVWSRAGGLESTYGRPLCDEQDLPDGGRCSIFEGAHIHLYNGEARGVPANQCTAPYQPTAPPRRTELTPGWPSQSGPSQPGPQPPMTVTPTHPANPNPEKEASCWKTCCTCSVEHSGRTSVCKWGGFTCCVMSVS